MTNKQQADTESIFGQIFGTDNPFANLAKPKPDEINTPTYKQTKEERESEEAIKKLRQIFGNEFISKMEGKGKK